MKDSLAESKALAALDKRVGAVRYFRGVVGGENLIGESFFVFALHETKRNEFDCLGRE